MPIFSCLVSWIPLGAAGDAGPSTTALRLKLLMTTAALAGAVLGSASALASSYTFSTVDVPGPGVTTYSASGISACTGTSACNRQIAGTYSVAIASGPLARPDRPRPARTQPAAPPPSKPMISRHAAFALVAGTLLIPAAAARAEPPASYCRRAETDDTLRPIPASLVPAARRLFGLRAPDSVVQRTTVFRCAGGAVLVCNTGANLPCGKANTDRDLPAAGRYCRDNPDASFIPMFVTGHDTIYRWRCRGTETAAESPVERLDERGFVARLWKPAS